MNITQLDHLVLTVKDIQASIDFYTRVLGMQEVEFADGRKALSFGRQKINLHVTGSEFTPHAAKPTPGSADLCFICDTSLEKILSELNALQVDIIEGPVERTGATVKLLSIYIADPDNNLIELAEQV